MIKSLFCLFKLEGKTSARIDPQKPYDDFFSPFTIPFSKDYIEWEKNMSMSEYKILQLLYSSYVNNIIFKKKLKLLLDLFSIFVCSYQHDLFYTIYVALINVRYEVRL